MYMPQKANLLVSGAKADMAAKMVAIMGFTALPHTQECNQHSIGTKATIGRCLAPNHMNSQPIQGDRGQWGHSGLQGQQLQLGPMDPHHTHTPQQGQLDLQHLLGTLGILAITRNHQDSQRLQGQQGLLCPQGHLDHQDTPGTSSIVCSIEKTFQFK